MEALSCKKGGEPGLRYCVLLLLLLRQPAWRTVCVCVCACYLSIHTHTCTWLLCSTQTPSQSVIHARQPLFSSPSSTFHLIHPVVVVVGHLLPSSSLPGINDDENTRVHSFVMPHLSYERHMDTCTHLGQEDSVLGHHQKKRIAAQQPRTLGQTMRLA